MTITPPVGGGRIREHMHGPMLFTIGALFGSLLLGVSVGNASVWLSLGRPAGVAVVCVGAAILLVSLLGVSIRIPSSHWQVPRAWMSLGRSGFALAFGTILGVGFLTVVTTAEYYLLLAICASKAPVEAATVFAAFGAGRAAPLWLARRCILKEASPRPYTVTACAKALLAYRGRLDLARLALVSLATAGLAHQIAATIS